MKIEKEVVCAFDLHYKSLNSFTHIPAETKYEYDLISLDSYIVYEEEMQINIPVCYYIDSTIPSNIFDMIQKDMIIKSIKTWCIHYLADMGLKEVEFHKELMKRIEQVEKANISKECRQYILSKLIEKHDFSFFKIENLVIFNEKSLGLPLTNIESCEKAVQSLLRDCEIMFNNPMINITSDWGVVGVTNLLTHHYTLETIDFVLLWQPKKNFDTSKINSYHTWFNQLERRKPNIKRLLTFEKNKFEKIKKMLVKHFEDCYERIN
jgi:hypothetical protein